MATIQTDAARARHRLGIVQSSYIPWKGYFDIIAAVDEFVFLDDAQFTRRDWRNRNLIKAPEGLRWLSIPVQSKGRYHEPIDAIEISEPWVDKHWRAIESTYRRAPAFAEFAPAIEELYRRAAGETRLSAVNRCFIEGICRVLGLATRLSWSRDYPVAGQKTDRLVSICTAARASHYLSGPSAAAYLEQDKFSAHGIEVSYMDYGDYPVYPQMNGAFEHGVTILDLIFNTGREAPKFMKFGGSASPGSR